MQENHTAENSEHREKKICQGITIAFQGEGGAFSECAARSYVDDHFRSWNAVTKGYQTFSDVFTAVESNACDLGILPIENSVSGTLHVMYDHLVRSCATDLSIIGECVTIEDHCLLTIDPMAKDLSGISRIVSHPVILEQCEQFIVSLEQKYERTISRVSSWDSSGACASVKAEGRATTAAIASAYAAKIHELHILQKGVGNELNSETRYLIIARKKNATVTSPLPNNKRLKSSIAVAVPNESGGLFKIVSAFALRNLPILKIESRPASSIGHHQQDHLDLDRHW